MIWRESNALHCTWAVDSILASVWWFRNSFKLFLNHQNLVVGKAFHLWFESTDSNHSEMTLATTRFWWFRNSLKLFLNHQNLVVPGSNAFHCSNEQLKSHYRSPWHQILVVKNVWNSFLTQNLVVGNAFHCIWAVDSITGHLWSNQFAGLECSGTALLNY